MGTLKKEAIVGVPCWELTSHLFKALILPTFTYGPKIWGVDFEISHWKVYEKSVKINVHSSTTYYLLLAEFGELCIDLYALKLTMSFQQWLAHLSPSWLIKESRLTLPTPGRTRI
jgi:hypothetical protein